MTEPYVFVSHKHADHEIAKVVADFVRTESGGRVEVHNSSDQRFERPHAGQSLNDALKDALARTSVLLLIYTDAALDWAYCLWESGVATDPKNPESTRVVLLQCGPQVPPPFADQLRVDVDDRASLGGFVADFLTDPEFFPGWNEALTKFNSDGPEVGRASDKFASALYEVLPPRRFATHRSMSLIQLDLDRDAVGHIGLADESASTRVSAEHLQQTGRISAAERAESYFGRHIDGVGFALLSSWEGREHREFFDSIAEQVGAAVQGRFPRSVPWSPLRGDHGPVPFLTDCRELSSGGWQFDFFLVPLRLPVDLATTRYYKNGATRLFQVLRDSSFVPDLIVGVARGGLVVAAELSRILPNLVPVVALWPHSSDDDVVGPRFDNVFNQMSLSSDQIEQWREVVKVLVVDDAYVSGDTLKAAKTYLSERLDVSRFMIQTAAVSYIEGAKKRQSPPTYLAYPLSESTVDAFGEEEV
jgi:hypoxanthine phosphoribosyltransferase